MNDDCCVNWDKTAWVQIKKDILKAFLIIFILFKREMSRMSHVNKMEHGLHFHFEVILLVTLNYLRANMHDMSVF